MKLRVIGCHGGETPKHRTSAFLLDDILGLDAGSLTSGLMVKDQARLKACLVSHAHLDHIRDLATLADNRCQMDCSPLSVIGTHATIQILKEHFFNDKLWPDFSKIPAGGGFTIEYIELPVEETLEVAGYSIVAIPVAHTIDTVGFVVRSSHGSIAYSGDTGPTDRFWEFLNSEVPDLKALLMEVSFPNREQRLATVSGHHTPKTLAADLGKLKRAKDIPTFLYHIKPVFQSEVEVECAALTGFNLEILKLRDQFSFG